MNISGMKSRSDEYKVICLLFYKGLPVVNIYIYTEISNRQIISVFIIISILNTYHLLHTHNFSICLGQRAEPGEN